MEWAGESSRIRAPTPPEWPKGPGGKKPQDPPQRPRTDRGIKDGGGGEGTKIHPPPEQPGGRVMTAATARRGANSKRRSHLR